MTVEECYMMLNADYQEVLSRLLKEERIEKYLNIFIDSGYYRTFEACLRSENWPEAFRAVHNLKGVSLTLGFKELYNASDALCEELRDCVRPRTDIREMVKKLQNEYNKVMDALKMLETSRQN